MFSPLKVKKLNLNCCELIKNWQKKTLQMQGFFNFI